MVELQSGYFRSDRGGEYTSLEFSKFCEDMGLERQLTVAYSPQQNGVAERKNRTVIEMARTMMFEKKIPLKFWAEVMKPLPLWQEVEDKVYRLRKALYGLKQAPMAWYSEIDTYLSHCGFHRSSSEATLYVRNKEGVGILIVSIYVDDIVYTGSSAEMMEEFKAEMMCKYEMSYLGLLHHFLGIGVPQTERSIFIHKRKYVLTLLDKFRLKDCKPVSTPLVATDKLKREDESEPPDESLYRKIVGSLLYLTATRPNIMFSTSLLARDRSGSEEDMKNTSRYAFSFGSGAFSWDSIKQHNVALSTAEAEYVSAAEAEYVSATEATSQAIWLRFVLEDFGEEQAAATTLLCDNTSAIAMSKNPVFTKEPRTLTGSFTSLEIQFKKV
ncbi:unnamed protein product [Prunus armeniaca]